MTTVITYGTYDLLHRGHIRLLERARALGDYLIVGVTADDFDKTRGKINVRQSLMERIEAVRATGLADKIIVEEYEGQKIDDILRFGVDVFTVGSDWTGQFDYLSEYCRVVYLERTEGVSSSEIRAESRTLKIGLVGNSAILNKFYNEAKYVNGVEISGVFSDDPSELSDEIKSLAKSTQDYSELLSKSDAVYIISPPVYHYRRIKEALLAGKHVLAESPIALSQAESRELFTLAGERGLVLSDGIKTAYSTAYSRMILLAKSGIIGTVVSVDAACTSLRNTDADSWNSITAWGPTALLPVFQLLGTDAVKEEIAVRYANEQERRDDFTKISFIYPRAVASVRVGQGVKTEGELVISGTKGYIYVPAPWWKTEYFEVRFENPAENKRYFYQLDGEGIRYEIAAFAAATEKNTGQHYVTREISNKIAAVMNDFYDGKVIKI